MKLFSPFDINFSKYIVQLNFDKNANQIPLDDVINGSLAIVMQNWIPAQQTYFRKTQHQIFFSFFLQYRQYFQGDY